MSKDVLAGVYSTGSQVRVAKLSTENRRLSVTLNGTRPVAVGLPAHTALAGPLAYPYVARPRVKQTLIERD